MSKLFPLKIKSKVSQVIKIFCTPYIDNSFVSNRKMTNFNCIYSYIVYFLNLFRSKTKFSNKRIVSHIFDCYFIWFFIGSH